MQWITLNNYTFMEKCVQVALLMLEIYVIIELNFQNHMSKYLS